MSCIIFKNIKKKNHSTFLIKFIAILFLIHIFHTNINNCIYIKNNLKRLNRLEKYRKNSNYYVPKCNLCFNCSVCIHEYETTEHIVPLVAASSKRKYFYDKSYNIWDDNTRYREEKKDAAVNKYNHYFKYKLNDIIKKCYNFFQNDVSSDILNNKGKLNIEKDISIDEKHGTENDETKINQFNNIRTSINDKVTLPLQELQDSQYIGYIQVGTPPQTIRPIFDTGSTNIWIVSTKCHDDTCLKVNRYNYKLSKSFRYLIPHKRLDIMFGTGMIQGIIGIDTFRIGPFKIENQSFGLVKKERGNRKKSNVFERINFEGIVGLAFPSMLSTGKTAIYENIITSNKLKHNEFSIYIGKDNKYSAIFFGGVDKKFFTGDIYMFPVVREYYWEINFDGLYIDHQKFCCDSNSIVYDFKRKKEKRKNSFFRKFFRKISHFKSENIDKQYSEDDNDKINKNKNYLIFDSGTSFNSVPKSEIDYFFKVVPIKKCDDNNIDEVVSSYPNLTYVINKMPFILTPTQYLIRKNNMCKPAFMDIEISSEFGHAYILGNATFMRYYYTVYRTGKRNEKSYVGIAKAVHEEDNQTYLGSLFEKMNKI